MNEDYSDSTSTCRRRLTLALMHCGACRRHLAVFDTGREDLTTVVRGDHFLLVSCVQKASAKDLIDTATQKSFFWASNARVVPGDCHPGLL